MSRLSNEKHRLIRSRHSQGLYQNSLREEVSRQQSEYEVLAQFELRRQKQKTRILEERLHNKQVFIHQMKQYQEQLTAAFEKCQQQLVVAKKQIQVLNSVERQQLQEMAQLKHLIIRLQEEINKRDVQINKRHFNSVKIEQENTPVKKRQIRSKTMMNEEENSPKALKDTLEQEIVKESKKITKFVNQFMMMAECFSSEVKRKRGNIKERLKVAWKWIKGVVKEWNELLKDREVIDDFIQKIKKYADIPKNTEKSEVFRRIMGILSE